MAVKCGNCKDKHETIADVRECYSITARELGEELNPTGAKPLSAQTNERHNPPSEPQVDFVEDLLSVRIWPDTYTRSEIKAMSSSQVSAMITGLKAADYKPRELKCPEGRYALEQPDNKDTPIAFYEIGWWQNHITIRRLVGAPGDFARQRVRDSIGQRILDAIEANPKEAMMRFADETECCGSCGSPLTNKDSRAARIGPVCAKKRDVMAIW